MVVEATSGSKGRWMAIHNSSLVVSESLYGLDDELRNELEVTIRCGSPIVRLARESAIKVCYLWFIRCIREG